MPEIVYGRSTPSIVFDKRGRASDGYLIEVEFTEFDEVHELRVPSMDEAIVKPAAEKLLEQRKRLAALSEDEGSED